MRRRCRAASWTSLLHPIFVAAAVVIQLVGMQGAGVGLALGLALSAILGGGARATS
jgi:hypothetical protein